MKRVPSLAGNAGRMTTRYDYSEAFSINQL